MQQLPRSMLVIAWADLRRRRDAKSATRTSRNEDSNRKHNLKIPVTQNHIWKCNNSIKQVGGTKSSCEILTLLKISRRESMLFQNHILCQNSSSLSRFSLVQNIFFNIQYHDFCFQNYGLDAFFHNRVFVTGYILFSTKV